MLLIFVNSETCLYNYSRSIAFKNALCKYTYIQKQKPQNFQNWGCALLRAMCLSYPTQNFMHWKRI